jgi:hypothetical protein
VWNGNGESLRTAFYGRESLFGYAVRHQRLARRRWPVELAGLPVVRLRSPAAVERWLASLHSRDPVAGTSSRSPVDYVDANAVSWHQ